jgi:hypothetical protein
MTVVYECLAGRLEYVYWARNVAKGLRGVNQKLEEQFDSAAAARKDRSSHLFRFTPS